MEVHKLGADYVKCEMCKSFATIDNAAKLGWDWFTGSLPRTHHFCNKHKFCDQHDKAFAKSQKPKEPQCPTP